MEMGAEARGPLLQASESRSLAVRAAANYQLASLDEEEGCYLQARLRAYLAVGAGASLPWSPTFETRCDVLIARALTKKALSYHDAEVIEWSPDPQEDVFSGLDEPGLRRLLARGATELSAAMLGPKVDRVAAQSPAERWAATCWRAPVEDFLNHFATRAGMDLRGVRAAAPIRRRPISLHFAGASMPRLCEVAAGSAGLIARFTGDQIIVYNPVDVESLEQHRDLLVGEAISAWRRFFLRTPSDKRVVEGHFAVAALHEFAGQTIDAISEYQLVAQRFARTRFAPLALLRSARLRMRLRDFVGARKDLTDLLDGYPDCHQSASAYAVLGEVAMKSGRPAEAFRIFRKLYFLDLSSSSRASAALGAGKCLYRQGKYELASKWLNTFVRKAMRSRDENLPEACLLLARSCAGAGMDKEAVSAFELALAAGIEEPQRTEARIELARTHWKLGNHARAITTLGDIDPGARTPAQNYRVLLLTTQIYRDMGLPERAGRFLTSNLSSIVGREYQAQLVVELARCYRDSGQTQLAYHALAGVFARLPAGESSGLAACELAQLCLATGKPAQAVTILQEVLGSSKASAYHSRARKLLVEAHLARQEYRSAMLAAPDKVTKGETR